MIATLPVKDVDSDMLDRCVARDRDEGRGRAETTPKSLDTHPPIPILSIGLAR